MSAPREKRVGGVELADGAPAHGSTQGARRDDGDVVTLEPDLRADSYDPFGDNTVVANGASKETVTGGGQDFTFRQPERP